MAKMVWDDIGQKYYETGVEQCALYVYDKKAVDKAKRYHNGVPWNGLTGVTEKPSGAEVTDLWANDAKYGSMIAAEKFGCSIEAYTYPNEWRVCDGIKELAPGAYVGQQTRATFGLAYKTLIGNDEDNIDHGYKLHLVYGCLASPSEKARKTVNESPEAVTFTWEVSTTPVNCNITGLRLKPTSYIELDSRDFEDDQWYKLQMIEDILYGKASYDDNAASDPYLPLPDEVNRILLTTRTIESIRIVSKPKKTLYYVGEKFDPEGLFVVAKYDDGTELDIDDYSISEVDTTRVGEQEVIVMFEGLEAAFNIEVKSRSYTGIELQHGPNKTIYEVGERFNDTGMVVVAVRKDGVKIKVTDYEIIGFDSTVVTEAEEVIVYYGGFEKTFTVKIIEPTVKVTSMKIEHEPTKTEYYVGEEFDSEGLEIHGIMSTGEETLLPAEAYSLSIPDMTTAGTKTITVTYLPDPSVPTVSFTIVVNEQKVTSIKVTHAPTKTDYFINDTFDPAGLEIHGVMSSGVETTLTESDYSLSQPDMATAGTKTVTVTYLLDPEVAPVSFEITVNSPTLW